ncbi:MAG TPA: riboflavin synthase [Vicinamibacterales bacterium]|nr:riboflavin synthase [Vicinamibacterales bacterium]
MFTGLIESVGTIDKVEASPAGLRLSVKTELATGLAHGDSLAINGVCLTVVATADGRAFADVSPETMRVTTLGALRPGTAVNLERSLRADARVGGHFVQGHVDGTGRIESIEPEGESYRVRVTFPSELEPFLVHKGSIAVDGISLTVASLDGNRFDVQIIPFTREHTNLRAARPGDAVNIECDILGKYVVRALERRGV